MNLDDVKIKEAEKRLSERHICNEMCLDHCGSCDESFCIEETQLLLMADGIKYCPECLEINLVGATRAMVSRT